MKNVYVFRSMEAVVTGSVPKQFRYYKKKRRKATKYSMNKREEYLKVKAVEIEIKIR